MNLPRFKRRVSMQLIKGGKCAVAQRIAALEKAREELGERLETFTPVLDKIFIEFGIPMEEATRKLGAFVSDIDQLLCEHFTWEPDERDK